MIVYFKHVYSHIKKIAFFLIACFYFKKIELFIFNIVIVTVLHEFICIDKFLLRIIYESYIRVHIRTAFLCLLILMYINELT